MLMLCNELPILSDVSSALPSRFIILQLTQSFFGREDRTLADKLMVELPGILNWAIVGWKRLIERGNFIQPKTAALISKTFDDLASPLRAFMEAYCDFGVGYEVAKRTLFEAYAVHRFNVGLSVPSSNWFSRNLFTAYPGTKDVLRGLSGMQVPHFIGFKLTDDGTKLAEEYGKMPWERTF
jgi:putative DNA primase/helicase